MIGRALVSVGLAALAVAPATPPVAHGQPPASPRLVAFGSCGQLLEHFKQRALGQLEASAREPQTVVGEQQTAAPAAGREQPFSTTNVQEPGVDEPDIVKSDGRRVFALFNDRLRAVDVRSGAPRLMGTLRLRQAARAMLLYRDRLLVFSDGGPVIPLEAAIAPQPPGGGQITEVDVGDPAVMRVVRTLSFPGRYVDSRLHGATARIVLSTFPRGPEPVPLPAGQEDPAAGLERQRQAIAGSALADWMPSYTLTDRRTGRSRSGLLVPCRSTLRQRRGDGGDLVSVLTVDLARGLPPVDADAMLISYANIVYASPASLYVVSQLFGGRDSAQAIHKLAAGRGRATVYRASGEVPGALVNQFALSERRGFLRVATTERRFEQRSESFVTVLAQRSGELRRVGRVGNLGRGEAIQAVRFIGDVGFVVTFRRVDPLYTLDLAHASRPRTIGQLKIRGFSAYLHPVGADLLLGVGQDATTTGMVLGTQVSLFDISNLRRPVRLDHTALGSGAFSEVEFDHHAFLYWPPARLAVAPVEVFARDRGGPVRAGAFGFRVGRGVGVERVGLVTHRSGSAWAPVRRSLVVGDRLITVSERGVEASGLDTLSPRGFARFPLAAQPRPTPR